MNLPELFRKIRSNLIFFDSNFKAPIYIEEASCFRPFRTVWRGLFCCCCKIDYFYGWGLPPPHPLALRLFWFLTIAREIRPQFGLFFGREREFQKLAWFKVDFNLYQSTSPFKAASPYEAASLYEVT